MTYNLRDFPEQIVARFDLTVMHPDDFLVHVFDLAPGIFCSAVKRQSLGLFHPPTTAEELLNTFQNQGLVQTAARLRQFIAIL